jgi:hypothetical protein
VGVVRGSYRPEPDVLPEAGSGGSAGIDRDEFGAVGGCYEKASCQLAADP